MTNYPAGTGSPPWQSIPAMLQDNLERFASQAAVVDGETRLTYAQLRELMLQMTGGLSRRNLAAGDVVVIWAPNSWQWVVAALACWWQGCIVVPISARGKILDALPILSHSRARMLITASGDSVHRPRMLADYLEAGGQSLAGALPELGTIVDISQEPGPASLSVILLAEFLQSGRELATAPAADVSGSDICEILFTSGSTGRPKGVIREHYQVIRNRWSGALRRGFESGDRILAQSPFSHTLGINGTLLRSCILGATLVISRQSNPRDIMALIREENITAMSGTPSLFISLLNEQCDGPSALSTIRLASVGASAIPQMLVHRLLAAGVDSISAGYGMTECDSIACATTAQGMEAVATTVGKPEDGVDVRIVDDHGNTVDSGDSGEIWIGGYTVTRGYFEDEVRTAQDITDDGWLKSGDLGRWTQEGLLQILGRKKEIIIVHGYTLYPAEIENILLQSNLLDAVAVIGVPHPVAGEQCVAFIVPADAHQFDLRALKSWARAHIADYKVPTRFLLIDGIPMNENKKVDQVALRNQAL